MKGTGRWGRYFPNAVVIPNSRIQQLISNKLINNNPSTSIIFKNGQSMYNTTDLILHSFYILVKLFLKTIILNIYNIIHTKSTHSNVDLDTLKFSKKLSALKCALKISYFLFEKNKLVSTAHLHCTSNVTNYLIITEYIIVYSMCICVFFRRVNAADGPYRSSYTFF